MILLIMTMANTSLKIIILSVALIQKALSGHLPLHISAIGIPSPGFRICWIGAYSGQTLGAITSSVCFCTSARFCFFLCLILFVLSLMAKPMLVTLPFIMLLLDYWPLERWQKAPIPVNVSVSVSVNKKTGKKKRKQRKSESSTDKKIAKPVKSGRQLIGNLLWEKVPFIFLAMILIITLIWQQQDIGELATLQKLPFSERIMNTIVSYVAYLGKTFWPVDLAVFYPYEYSFQICHIGGTALILIIISIAAIYFIKKAPFLFVGWLWYLGTLIPVIGLMQVGKQAMADRYTYLPFIGIAVMLTWGIVYLLPKENRRKIILFPAAVIILSVLTILTWQQCGYWKNSTTLFSHSLQVTKNNYLAHTNLGIILAEEGKTEEAFSHFRAALKIRPDDDNVHYNLATVFKEQGKLDEAIVHFRETLRINPYYIKAHNNLAIIFYNQNKYTEAIYHFRQALQIKPNNPYTIFYLGVVLGYQGNLEEAIEHFRRAIELKPDFAEARRALKLALELEQQKR